MKRTAVVLFSIVLGACATVPSGIFARVTIGAGKQTIIFSNPEQIDEKIAVKVSDNSASKDSLIQLKDADGKVLKEYPIADGTTETFHLTVRGGEWLNLVCNGTRGGCTYSVGGE